MSQRFVRFMHRIKGWSAHRAEDGQGMVEYALITSLISVAVLVVTNVGGLGTAITNMYNQIPGAF